MELQTLSNGRKIPVLGLGTWFIDDDKAAQAVVSAVEIGYRHIDTAQASAATLLVRKSASRWTPQVLMPTPTPLSLP